MSDHGIAAACLLAALGRDDQESDAEYVRAYVGATLIADAIAELRVIRKALTTTKE